MGTHGDRHPRMREGDRSYLLEYQVSRLWWSPCHLQMGYGGQKPFTIHCQSR